jgi:ketosteroid isomerase-like protein
MKPEDITRFFVERSNAGDADGVAALYEDDAVLAYPPGGQTVGRAAIHELWASVLSSSPHFEPEDPLPTIMSGDLALTSTIPKDGAGIRAQVVRRQPDGSWLLVLDYPSSAAPRVDQNCNAQPVGSVRPTIYETEAGALLRPKAGSLNDARPTSRWPANTRCHVVPGVDTLTSYHPALSPVRRMPMPPRSTSIGPA